MRLLKRIMRARIDQIHLKDNNGAKITEENSILNLFIQSSLAF